MEVIPDCPTVFTLNNGETLIWRGSTLCSNFLRFRYHLIDALLRVGTVQSLADSGCVDIIKVVQLLLSEELVLLNKLSDTTLNLCPRQL